MALVMFINSLKDLKLMKIGEKEGAEYIERREEE
jgi:hypothetical protein